MITSHNSSGQSLASDEVEPDLDEWMLRFRMANIGRKLLVLSGKGGVGKSTVAANLAVAMANAGKSVGLLDVDVHGPSIPTLMGLKGKTPDTFDEGLVPVSVQDNLSVMSVGFLLSTGRDPVLWRGPKKHTVIRQLLRDVAWGRLDYLVVDSPPGTGDELMSIAQLAAPSAAAIIVTTPQQVAISDVRRCVSFCRTLSLPILGVVENMSGFVCPGCGKTVDLFKRGGGMALALEMGVRSLGQIPLDIEVVMTGDAGIPLVRDGPKSPAAAAFGKVVDAILAADTTRGASKGSANGCGESSSLRIVVPVMTGKVSPRLEACKELAIFDVDRQKQQVVHRSVEKAPRDVTSVLPRLLQQLGADVVIAGEMSLQVQQRIVEEGIEILPAVRPERPDELVSDYLHKAPAAATGRH